MKRKLFSLFINIAVVFACFLPLTTGCSREISKSDRYLYLKACDAVNEYAGNSSISNNSVKTTFNSTNPLTCKSSNLDEDDIKKSLIVTDIQSLSQTGPLTAAVTFKAPLRGSSSNALLSVRLVFDITDSSVNTSLTEYIYCTTSYHGNDARHACNDYDTSGRAAYTSSDVTEIIRTGAYKKTSTSHGSIAKAAANKSFNFSSGIKLRNGNVKYEGNDTQVYNGIVQIAIAVSIDDGYESPEQTIIALCEEGLNTLYSSKNYNGYSYTYLDAAIKRLQNGLDASYFTAEKLGKTKITYTIDEADINSSVKNDIVIYKTTEIAQSDNTSLTYSMVTFKYNIRAFNANGAFATSYTDTIILGKIENSSTGTSTWYILNSDTSWSEDTGFSTSSATEIKTGDEYRCPDGDRCSLNSINS